jgi:hypothetical protein
MTGAIAVIAANVGLRPIGRDLNRRTGASDVEIIYLFRIGTRADQGVSLRKSRIRI